MAQVTTAKKNIKRAVVKEVKTAPKTAFAKARFLRVSPRKARLVTNLLKGMWVNEAMAQLQFVHKKSAGLVRDVLKSAIANAENNFKLNRENLYIKSITADGGAKIKRYMPRARGSASEIRRPLTHINVLLEERKRTGKGRSFKVAEKSKAEAKAPVESEEPTNQQEAAESRTRTNQAEKTSQDLKQGKVTQKRRLFNRKSGV